MTVPEAIRAIERLGVDVYVARNQDLVLRAQQPGVRVPDAAIAIAKENRDAIAAFGIEWYPERGRLFDCTL